MKEGEGERGRGEVTYLQSLGAQDVVLFLIVVVSKFLILHA